MKITIVVHVFVFLSFLAALELSFFSVRLQRQYKNKLERFIFPDNYTTVTSKVRNWLQFRQTLSYNTISNRSPDVRYDLCVN